MRYAVIIVFFLCAVALSSVAKAAGTSAAAAQMGSIAPGSSLYIEPFSEDRFSMEDRLGNALLKSGYRLVADPSRAQYVIKWSYVHGAFPYASVRVLSPQGDVVSFGEGKNPGIGTILNKVGTTWGCIRRAAEHAGLTLN